MAANDHEAVTTGARLQSATHPPRRAISEHAYTQPRVVVPRWRYEAFQRWFAPTVERDGVNAFVGRAWRAPGG
jgi:hypothetical protein